ncbi:hypothetical protein BDB00DRAFT_748597, partial [Zychaea mexicana]|uniref:uncharacterized protein n=1 Tax=Zychaea mexicana TaxID=64656 RepID=UPI0022FEBDBA
QLKAELARQRYCLENLEIERQQYRLDSRALTDRIAKVQERLQQRQEARHQLEGNYNEHLRGLRATDDDLASISGKLRQLKAMIAHLADDLLENVDPKRATGALRNFWLNLKQPIEQMGALLPLNRIRMLTEKYMMDYLIPNMTPHFFPGLSVEKDYIALEYWLRNHDRYTATRLRQELAKSVVADAQRLLAKPIKQAAHGLYSNLNEAYPYMQQYDNTESDPEKRYETKVRKLVEYSIALGFAMKGQEVDIVATVVQEGVQPFNHVTMVDEEGLTSGIIEFCICPPFVIYDTMPYTVLEKGRVFC